MKPPVHLLSLAALVFFAGCDPRHPAAHVQPDLPALPAEVLTTRLETIATPIELTGTIRPVQRAVVAARLMGAIEALPVDLGQSVRAGDIVARIAGDEISARVLQAKSQLNLVRRDLDRERDLLPRGASTPDTVRGLEDRFAAAEAVVREAEATFAYATLRAPFDGVVARKTAHVGDLATPGLPLLEIEGTRAFEVEASLPDSLARQLKVGDTLSIIIPHAPRPVIGTIAELSSAADPAAHTLSAKIAIPSDAAVRSGQFVRVQLHGAPVSALLVPSSAVSTYGQVERVFIVGPDRRAVLRLVKTGMVQRDRTEILAGLDAAEIVIVNPPATLREGQPLELRP